MKKRLAICSSSLIAATLSFSVVAADNKNFWMQKDRFNLNVGGFISNSNTEARLSSDILGVGTLIDFEDDLGLEEDETVARIDGHYRFKPRHRIDFSWFDLSRDGRETLLRDIQYEDTIFTAGTAVDSELGFTVIKVVYTYSFFQKEKIDLGVSTGLYVYDFESEIVAPETRTKEESDGTAPFPTFGLRVTWAFKPELFFRAHLDYFDIDRSDVEGEVIDILVALEHQTWKNVGLGIGYNDVDAEGEDKEDRDEVKLEYDGLLLYAKIYF